MFNFFKKEKTANTQPVKEKPIDNKSSMPEQFKNNDNGCYDYKSEVDKHLIEGAMKAFEKNGNTLTEEMKMEIIKAYHFGETIPDIDSMNANASPSKNGLFPNEILMLDYSRKYKTNNNDFPGFWLYEYGVKQPQELLKSLENRGFIISGDVEDALVQLKVADIKAELTALGLTTTGKKWN